MPPAFNAAAYLARLGLRAPPPPTLAGLRALTAAHMAAIPFEGIDPFIGRPVSADLEVVQNKILHARRGGFCFELNGLLLAALEAFGFNTLPVLGRVRWSKREDEPHPARTHLAILVDLGEEGRWLADVGFGGLMPDEPLRFIPGLVQETGLSRFRIDERDGDFWLLSDQPTGWRTLYVFDLTPALASDCEIGAWFASTHPVHARLPQRFTVEMVRDRQRYRINDALFVVEGPHRAVISSTPLTSGAQLGQVLDEVFGVVPDVPPEVIFDKILATLPSA